jgi:hypothetical protein
MDEITPDLCREKIAWWEDQLERTRSHDGTLTEEVARCCERHLTQWREALRRCEGSFRETGD